MSSGRTHTERLIGINNSCQVTQEAPQCVVAALESNWRQDWRTRSSEASPLCNVRSAIVERKREEITIPKNEMMTDVLGNHKARSSKHGRRASQRSCGRRSPANYGSRPSSHSETWHRLVSGLTVTFSTIRRVKTPVNRTVVHRPQDQA